MSDEIGSAADQGSYAPRDRIRVLIVYHHLPHYRYDVFRRLQDHPDLEVEFAAARESSDGSIPTIPPDLLQRFHTLENHWFGPFLWQAGLLRLLVRRRPHVVIFLGVFAYVTTWLGGVLSRARGAGVLFWTIGWHRPERGLRRRFRLAFYGLADRLLIYGVTGREIGAAMGYPRRRMTVVYNSSSDPFAPVPADPAELAAFASRLPPEGQETVAAVIRLNPVKRLDLLVRAAQALRIQGRNVAVLLVGEGPEKSRLADLAAELDVPLYLPGPAYGDEYLSLVYQRSLVTVVPSAAGLTVLQSFKYGRPVITHDNLYEQMPECEAIVNGETGELYAYGDLDSLTAALSRWLDRQHKHADVTAARCRAMVKAPWSADYQATAYRRTDQAGGPPGPSDLRWTCSCSGLAR